MQAVTPQTGGRSGICYGVFKGGVALDVLS